MLYRPHLLSPHFIRFSRVVYICSCWMPRRCRPSKVNLIKKVRDQASGFARHSGRSHRGACYYDHTPGSRDFYVHAYLGSLPPRAVDMLAVRIEQLTAEGLSPSKIRGLAGRS